MCAEASDGFPSRLQSELTVAIVDDDPNMCSVLAEYLEFEGYGVVACGSGKALLARARWSPPPAVIVLDLVLRDMSGGQCLHALRESRWGHVPVIVFSAWNDPERLGLGAQGFVRKAADPVTLVRNIDRLVRRGSQHQQPLEPGATHAPSRRTGKERRPSR